MDASSALLDHVALRDPVCFSIAELETRPYMTDIYPSQVVLKTRSARLFSLFATSYIPFCLCSAPLRHSKEVLSSPTLDISRVQYCRLARSMARYDSICRAASSSGLSLDTDLV